MKLSTVKNCLKSQNFDILLLFCILYKIYVYNYTYDMATRTMPKLLKAKPVTGEKQTTALQ